MDGSEAGSGMKAGGDAAVVMKKLGFACEGLQTLTEEIAALDKKLSEMKARKKDLARELAATFIDAGLQRTSYNGRTYYLHVDRFVRKAGGVSQPEACAALRCAAMDHFISESYNASQVRAHIKEAHGELPAGTPFEDALPAPLKGLFYTEEEATLRSRGG